MNKPLVFILSGESLIVDAVNEPCAQVYLPKASIGSDYFSSCKKYELAPFFSSLAELKNNQTLPSLRIDNKQYFFNVDPLGGGRYIFIGSQKNSVDRAVIDESNRHAGSIVSSNDFLRILYHLPVHCCWLDSQHGFLGASQLFLHLLGLSNNDELSGKSYQQLAKQHDICSALLSEMENATQQVMASSHSVQSRLTMPLVFSDGAAVYFSAYYQPIINAQGKVDQMVILLQDITPLKQAERALMQVADERALMQVADERAQMEKRLFRFTQDQEHDIRTPISGMTMAAQTLKQAQTNGMAFNDNLVEELIDGLLASSQRLLDYQESLLFDLYDDESCGRSIFTRFNLSELARAVFELNQAAATAKQLDYHYQFDESIPKHLIGDPKNVYQCLVDLLGNAIQFTETGHVDFTVTYLGEQQGRAMVRFLVKDSGIGIALDKQAAIYQAYVKLKASNEGQSPGRGMGLTRVAQYVHRVNGEINFESKSGQGSVFRMVLPFVISYDQTDS